MADRAGKTSHSMRGKHGGWNRQTYNTKLELGGMVPGNPLSRHESTFLFPYAHTVMRQGLFGWNLTGRRMQNH